MTESGLYVYVSQQGAKQISVFRMSPAGELNKVQDVSVTGKVMPMALSPDRRFLFAALRTEPYSIASFAIDGANGMLTHLGNAPARTARPTSQPTARAGSCSARITRRRRRLPGAPAGSVSVRSVSTGTCRRRIR